MMLAQLTYVASLALSLQGPLVRPTLSVTVRRAAVGPSAMASLPLGTPENVGVAKKRFQESYGKILSMPAQAFVNNMLMQQVALIAPNYQYSRVFAVGFESLCTVFLPSTCSTPENAEQARRALYAGLGMDPDQCKADSESLLSLAAGKTEADLLESEDFAKIKEADFKYSYQFGAGLVALMKAVGTEPSADAISRWCTALDLNANATLTRDWEFYESQIVKLEGLKEMLLQMTAASKRNEADRLKAKAAEAAKEAAEAEAEAAVSE